MKKISHGGNIYKKAKEMGIREEDILDFSANISPLGLPEHIRKAMIEAIDGTINYPDPDCSRLKEAISKQDNVPESHITCGNGGADLLYRLAFGLHPKKVLLPAPAFVEYEEALSAAGAQMEYYLMRDDFVIKEDILEQITEDTDFVVICNPNNPTSSAIMQEDLRKLIAFCADKDIFVMIDETYVEFAPDVEEITAIPLTREFTNLMVLRGVSKFYAAPGMRLGYGITGNMEFLSKMREKQTPWSLNSLGAFAGELMLRDHDYIQETRDLILDERDRMEQELQNIPTFKVYPAYANFILLKIRRDGLTSADVFEACIKKGLMIRDCSSFQCLDGEFVRFCIMMPDDNTKLLNVLKQL